MSSDSNSRQNDNRRSQMMSMKMQSMASMSDRHLVASELWKKQTSQKFTTKSSRDLQSGNRTDKLMKMMSVSSMSTSVRNLAADTSEHNSRSFKNLNANRNSETRSKTPVKVDRKDKLIRMHSLQPMIQKGMRNSLPSTPENKPKCSFLRSS